MNPGGNLFDPAGFIVCARYLQQGSVSSQGPAYSFVGLQLHEASLRSAINRAYVAAFCAVRNHLLDRGQIAPSAHYTQVQRSFLNNPDPRYQRIAIALERLRRNQLAADFERMSFPPLVGKAYFMVNSADHILDAVKHL
jgi:hypothetical protein